MEPKSDPRRTKIEDKNEVEKEEKEDLKDRLGAVLGRSWVVLGAVLGSFLMVLYWFFLYYFVEIDVFDKNGFKRRLGPILGRFGWPRGSKMGAKENQQVR